MTLLSVEVCVLAGEEGEHRLVGRGGSELLFTPSAVGAEGTPSLGFQRLIRGDLPMFW